MGRSQAGMPMLPSFIPSPTGDTENQPDQIASHIHPSHRIIGPSASAGNIQSALEG